MLEALKRRDRKTQEELRRRLFPKVMAVCLHMLKERTRAEECAEDIWMDFVYQHVDKVKKQSAIDAYVRMMTVRRCVRIRQWAERHEEASEQAPLVSGSEEGMLAAVDDQKSLARLRECLGRLTEKVRRMLRMRYHQEMTQAEIGKVLGVSKQYAGRVLARSLERLRACMEEAA